MKVLVVNCGSSTPKFQLIETDNDATLDQQRRLARGIVDRVGGRARRSPRLTAKLQRENRSQQVRDDCNRLWPSSLYYGRECTATDKTI